MVVWLPDEKFVVDWPFGYERREAAGKGVIYLG
jgi:hypothetical protein